MSKSYWRWHKRYAILPKRVCDRWIWFRPYWWRVVFDIDMPFRTVTFALDEPAPYGDDDATRDGVEQFIARAGLKKRLHNE